MQQLSYGREMLPITQHLEPLLCQCFDCKPTTTCPDHHAHSHSTPRSNILSEFQVRPIWPQGGRDQINHPNCIMRVPLSHRVGKQVIPKLESRSTISLAKYCGSDKFNTIHPVLSI
ncbi:hypothetical protein V6N12_066153 [Hibiscus sabdariffa]|uniref:Uncharacterized protein n=1 Tax=Hibiscus sabdariffa TaxID=183260 RepID=A0ABR2B947_9ROSI